MLQQLKQTVVCQQQTDWIISAKEISKRWATGRHPDQIEIKANKSRDLVNMSSKNYFTTQQLVKFLSSTTKVIDDGKKIAVLEIYKNKQ